MPRRRLPVLTLVLCAAALAAWTAARNTAPSSPSTRVMPPPALADVSLVPSHKHPLLGRPAPDIELRNAAGEPIQLHDLLNGRPAVVIFYYGCDCISCVRQLCEVNRDLARFRACDARVVAVSADDPESLRAWFKKEGPLGFPCLADSDGRAAHAFGVYRGDYRRHGTFIIDRDNTVRWANIGDAPFRHNGALLAQLARLDRASIRQPAGHTAR